MLLLLLNSRAVEAVGAVSAAGLSSPKQPLCALDSFEDSSLHRVKQLQPGFGSNAYVAACARQSYWNKSI